MLGLIRSAPERYATVRAALRYRGDGRVRREISERVLRSEDGRRAFGIPTREASDTIQRPARYTTPDGPLVGAPGRGSPTGFTGAWRRACRAAGSR